MGWAYPSLMDTFVDKGIQNENHANRTGAGLGYWQHRRIRPDRPGGYPGDSRHTSNSGNSGNYVCSSYMFSSRKQYDKQL